MDEINKTTNQVAAPAPAKQPIKIPDDSINSDTPSNVGSAVTITPIAPEQILDLAKGVLIVLALLFVLGAVTVVIWPDSPVFDACKTILPSIGTLVLGFYFAKGKGGSSSS